MRNPPFRRPDKRKSKGRGVCPSLSADIYRTTRFLVRDRSYHALSSKLERILKKLRVRFTRSRKECSSCTYSIPSGKCNCTDVIVRSVHLSKRTILFGIKATLATLPVLTFHSIRVSTKNAFFLPIDPWTMFAYTRSLGSSPVYRFPCTISHTNCRLCSRCDRFEQPTRFHKLTTSAYRALYPRSNLG